MSPRPDGNVPQQERLDTNAPVGDPAPPEPHATAEDGSRRDTPARRGAVALACIAVLLGAADTYVVVLALPDIMAGIGLSLEELHRATPIISAFLLGYITMLPLVGRLSDVWGRVPVLIGSLVVFAVGSLLTATADGLPVAVIGRGLQGAGGGGLVPATLALVADVWPPQRRGLPLGAVGAVQEAGSVLGPLYGAALVAASGWRAIFWVNLVAGVALAAALAGVSAAARVGPQEATAPRARGRRIPRGGAVARWLLAAIAAVFLLLAAAQPRALAEDVTIGAAFVPLAGTSVWASPLGLSAVVAAGLAVVSAVRARRQVFAGMWHTIDLVGAGLLAVALAGVVVAFAAADPARQAVAESAPQLLTVSAVAAVLFVVRQRRASQPLVPRRTLRQRAAWGALLVNLFVGAALVVALVNVPVFARATRFPDSQLAAALVLVQLLTALAVGALAGGWALSHVAPRWVAAAGLALCAGGFVAMATWDERALYALSSSAALVAAGLGFGLAVAPVNAALLAATDRAVHGVASALSVVARMVGMLTGLSVLTAVGLRVFYREQAAIGTPLTLCPDSPQDCPVYEAATRSAIVHELSVMFAGAAVCALVGAVLAALLLTPSTDARA